MNLCEGIKMLRVKETLVVEEPTKKHLAKAQ